MERLFFTYTAAGSKPSRPVTMDGEVQLALRKKIAYLITDKSGDITPFGRVFPLISSAHLRVRFVGYACG